MTGPLLVEKSKGFLVFWMGLGKEVEWMGEGNERERDEQFEQGEGRDGGLRKNAHLRQTSIWR